MQPKKTSVLSSVMLVLFLCLFFILEVNADEYNHIYCDNEDVVLWMNTVGPYHNRQETYAYFSLPFCVGPRDVINHYRKTLIEVIQGVDIESSGLEIHFKENIPSTPYCEILLTKEKQKALIHAVKNHYWYQMYLDDIPVWGFVGEEEVTESGTNYYLWTHKKFEIGYNGKQIVDVNLTSENKVNLVEVERIQFTYEVIWEKSSIKFEDRIDKDSDPNFHQFRLHWFSFLIIFLMVIFCIGLVSMILTRMLRMDNASYSKDEELIDEMDNQKSVVVS